MGAHELLERGDLLGIGVVHAVDEDVGTVREAVVAAEVIGGRRVELRERVLALDRVVGSGGAASRAPSTNGAVRARSHHHEADPGMGAQALEQSGMARAICSTRPLAG